MSQTDRDKWNKRYCEGTYADRAHPSALLEQWLGRLTPGRALDVACGAGRNALYLAGRGFEVDAVDIAGEALRRGRERAREAGLEINWLEQDLDEALALEQGYQLILVIRYVNLPLLRRLATLLGPGGYLVCEEHLQTSAEVIGPGNPAFRVQPGELLQATAGLEVLHHWEGLATEPDGQLAALAQIAARKA